jgi:hypothetical protein
VEGRLLFMKLLVFALIFAAERDEGVNPRSCAFPAMKPVVLAISREMVLRVDLRADPGVDARIEEGTNEVAVVEDMVLLSRREDSTRSRRGGGRGGGGNKKEETAVDAFQQKDSQMLLRTRLGSVDVPK